MVKNDGINSDNSVEFLSTATQSIEIFRLLRIGGEIRREVRVAEHPFANLHVAREWPGRCDGDTGILDALVEEVGIFNKGGNEFAVFYFDDRVLPEEAAARAEFEIVLQENEKDAGLVVLGSECLDECVGDINFFFGVGFEREKFRDFVKNIEGAHSDFGFV